MHHNANLDNADHGYGHALYAPNPESRTPHDYSSSGGCYNAYVDTHNDGDLANSF